MKRVLLFTLLFFISWNFVFASSPYNSASSNFVRKNWTSSATWASSNIPPTTGFSTNDAININYGSPYQSIKYAGTLNFQSGSNVSLTVGTGDTLICDGLTITSGCNVTINGVLIVTGNFTNSGGITVGNTIIVKGNLDNTSGNINNGTTYTFGTVINAGSGSSTRKTQTDFNTDFASSSNVYKSSSNASSWYVATYTWDGGGSDNNWMTAANWVGDVAPTGGENLVFAGSTRTSPVNNFTAGTSFNSISFSSGASNFTLSGNAFTLSGGATAITASNTSNTMTINNNITINTADPTITTSTGGSLTIAGTIANGGYLITVAGTGTTTMSGVISGTGGLTIYTAIDNVTVASGVNTFTGIVTITAGGLRITNASGLGSGTKTTVITWGTWGQPNLRLDGSGGNISLPSTLSFLTSTHDGNFGGIVNEAGNNTIAGNFSLTNGGGETRFLVNAGTLTVSGTITPTMSGRGIYFDGAGNGTFSGVFADGSYAPTLIKQGSGTWTLSNANTYTGATTILAGTLVLQDQYATPSFAISSGAILELNRTSNLTYTTNTIFTGAGTLKKTGGGTIVWGSAVATFAFSSGALIDVEGGIFTGGSNGNEVWTSNLSDLTVASGAEFDGVDANVRVNAVNGAGAISSGWMGSGSIIMGVNNGSGTFTGIISNYNTGSGHTGAIEKVGSGTQTLSGANTYTRTTTIIAGVLKIQGVAFTTTARAYSIASGAVLNIDGNTGVPIYSTSITGTGTLRITGGAFANESPNTPNYGNGTITMSMGSGGLIDVQSGASIVNGGWQDIDWSSNLATLNVDGTFDVWDGNTVYVDALTGSGTVTKGSGSGNVILTIGKNNGSGTFSGTIKNTSGTLSITKVGSGTQTLSGGSNLIYTGATSVSAGTLILVDCGALASGTSPASFDISSGAVLEFNANSNTLNLGSTAASGTVITGTGTLRKTGGWPLGLCDQGSSSYKVYLNMTGGLIDIEGGVIMNGGWAGGEWTNNKAGLYIASGARFDVSSGNTVYVDALTGSGQIDKEQGGAGTINVGVNNGSGTFSGIIQNPFGSISIRKQGSGTQTLSGANTFTGGVNLNAGQININNATALGTGTFTIAGGTTIDNTSGGSITLTNNNVQTWNGDFTFAGTNALNLGTGTVTMGSSLRTVTTTALNLTVGGTITGTGGLTKSGNGTMALGSVNASNWTGTTTVNGGTLQLGNPGGDQYVSTSWVINSGGTVLFTASNVISNSAIITINSGGTFNMNSSYYDAVGYLAGAGNVTNLNSLQLDLPSTGSGSNFSGVISGSGNINIRGQLGSGTQIFSGLNTYTGITCILNGTLSINTIGTVNGGASAIGNPSSSTNGTIGIGSTTTTGTLVYTGTAQTTDRVINLVGTTGGAVIDQSGTGNLKFSSALTATGSGAKTLTLQGSSAGAGEIGGAIVDGSGTTSIVKLGTGTWTLSGANTFSGGVSLNAGQININNASALGTGTFIIADGTKIDNTSTASITNSNNNAMTWNGNFTYTGSYALNLGTGAVAMGSSCRTVTTTASTLTVGGTISGTGGLTKSGNGTLALGTISATNWTGTTTINAGNLQLGNPGGDSYASTNWVVNSGGTLTYTANDIIVNNALITVNASGTLAGAGHHDGIGSIAGAGTISNYGATLTVSDGSSPINSTFSGSISGTSSITTWNYYASSTGTLTLSGTNSYSGATSIAANTTIKLGSTSALGSTSGVTVNSGGVLDLNGINYSLSIPLTLNGTGISSGGALLNSSSTAAIYAGLLALGSASSIVASSGDITLSHSGTITGATYGLTIDGSHNTAIASIIGTSTGTITKNGSGTLTLSGANTFTGLTTVNAGILKLGSTTALGSVAAGTVINSGAALDLNGKTYANAEALTIDSTGVSSSGVIYNSSATAATFPGAITLASASTIKADNQITLSGTISNNQDFTKTGSNSLIFTNNTITVNNLTISTGTLNGGSSTINVYGNFTNSGTFIPNTNGVYMVGSDSQTIPTVTFNNLTINNTAGASLGGNISVNGTLTMTAGILTTGTYAVDLGSTGSIVEATPSATAPTSYVTGTVKATRPLMQNVQNTFGGIGVDITEANINNNSTQVIRTTGTGCTGNGKTGIKRYYTITPTTDVGLSDTMVFHYFDAELNGNIEANLAIYKSTDSRVHWYQQNSIINTVANTMTLTGITSFSDWTASDVVNNSLPITLTYFGAQPAQESILLSWTTATEINNSYFILERSVDGVTWDNIYTCDGAGTSTQQHVYSFDDQNPLQGINYYRLKQTDIDGAFTYSSVVSAKIKNETIDFIVYPNPGTIDELTVQLQSTRDEIATITIHDMYGREMCSGQVEISGSPIQIKISDICHVPMGEYILSVQSNDVIEERKIIIQ